MPLLGSNAGSVTIKSSLLLGKSATLEGDLDVSKSTTIGGTLSVDKLVVTSKPLITNENYVLTTNDTMGTLEWKKLSVVTKMEHISSIGTGTDAADLIKSNQEQQEEIDLLKSENIQQKTELDTLKTEVAAYKSILNKLTTSSSFAEFKRSL